MRYVFKYIEVTINMINNWDDLECDIDLLRGIYAYGFEEPSTIQKRAILPFLSGKDIIAQAQSGTGKTGAFTIGVLGRTDISLNETQCIIMAPTRELSKQIFDVLTNLSKMMKNVKLHLLVGGTSIESDINALKSNPQIIVGCPGRINDMVRRRRLRTKHVKCIVLDEADEMLSQGFKDQIYSIFRSLNEETVQIALFSATLSPELVDLSKQLLRDPEEIYVKSDELTLEGIAQAYVMLENEHQKYDTLKDLYSRISVTQCIIYCNSVKRVIKLHDDMKRELFPVCCLHSDQTRDERETAFQNFKNGKYRVLISTNITARGIDIQQVSSVINFDVPNDTHTYLHRIGRSGRWGRKGIGINLITQRDIKNLRDIEKYFHTEINELTDEMLN